MVPEVENYIEVLREARAQVANVLDGLTADALNWHPLPDETNSLYALAVHLLGAERRWLHREVGGRKIERDRDAEFRSRGDEIASLLAAYHTVTRDSEITLAELQESELGALRGHAPEFHSVRWCILHVIEHYNEHIGQMRLTRQLWENRTARPHEI
jgi:uncharacterized damage-inducible protein DinB